MKLNLTLTLALLLLAMGVARARVDETSFSKGAPVLVIGEVTSPPKTRLGEQKMQVAVGPEQMDYTLHFFRAQLLGLDGKPLDEGDFKRGIWVRAEGSIMNDPRRVKVSRLQVIARNRAALAHSAFLPPDQEYGYIASVAGTRQTFPDSAEMTERATPVLVVGRVAGRVRLPHEVTGLTLTVAGIDWILEVPEEVTAQEIQSGQWVRVYGWRVADLRVRAGRIAVIGSGTVLRRSGFYRAESPRGYAEALDASILAPNILRGTIRSVDTAQATLTVRTTDGRERHIWLPAAEISVCNRPDARDYRVGDEVEVTIYTFP